MRSWIRFALISFVVLQACAVRAEEGNRMNLPGLLKVDDKSGALMPLAALSGTKDGIDFQMAFRRIEPELRCKVTTSWDGKATVSWIGYTQETCPQAEQPQYCRTYAEQHPDQTYLKADNKDFAICDTEKPYSWVDPNVPRPPQPGYELLDDSDKYIGFPYPSPPGAVFKKTDQNKWYGPRLKYEGRMVPAQKNTPPIINSKVVEKDSRVTEAALAEVNLDQAACLARQREEFEKLKKQPQANAFLKAIALNKVNVLVKDFHGLAQYQTPFDIDKSMKLGLSIEGQALTLTAFIDPQGSCVFNSLKSMASQIQSLKKQFDFVAANALTKPKLDSTPPKHSLPQPKNKESVGSAAVVVSPKSAAPEQSQQSSPLQNPEAKAPPEDAIDPACARIVSDAEKEYDSKSEHYDALFRKEMDFKAAVQLFKDYRSSFSPEEVKLLNLWKTFLKNCGQNFSCPRTDVDDTKNKIYKLMSDKAVELRQKNTWVKCSEGTVWFRLPDAFVIKDTEPRIYCFKKDNKPSFSFMQSCLNNDKEACEAIARRYNSSVYANKDEKQEVFFWSCSNGCINIEISKNKTSLHYKVDDLDAIDKVSFENLYKADERYLNKSDFVKAKVRLSGCAPKDQNQSTEPCPEGQKPVIDPKNANGIGKVVDKLEGKAKVADCVSLGNLRQAPIGSRCHTSSGEDAVFTLISRDKLGKEIWKDEKSGVIWGDLLDKMYTQSEAQHICQKTTSNTYRLPEKSDFEEAEKDGFREVLPHLRDRWFWYSAASVASRVAFPAFRGDDGKFENRIETDSVRCVLSRK